MVFGHLEVLHAKFHDRTISNLGDYVAQTNKHTDKQTHRQTGNANYYVDENRKHPSAILDPSNRKRNYKHQPFTQGH